MTLAPRSLAWLVWWDLRIRLRVLAIGRLRPAAVILYALFAVVAHVIAGITVWGFMHGSRAGRPDELLRFGGSMLAFLMFFMLMAGLLGAFRSVLSGRELSLYLGAPVPFRRVLWMRCLSLVFGAWSSAVLFALPVAHAGAVLGAPQLLLIYPVTLSLAACVTAFSLAVVAVVLRLFPLALARRVLQYAQIVMPLAFVLLIRNGGAPQQRVQGISVGGLSHFQDVLLLPARAIRGDLDALVVVIAVAALALTLAVQLVRPVLVAALQEPDAAPRQKARADEPRRNGFGRPLWWLVPVKEWRTIAREPRLSAALLVQPLIVLPFFYLNLMQGRWKLAGVASAASFVCGQMSQYVANLMISAEEAPGLLGTAPVSRTQLIRYKCLAALLPIAALLLVPVIWLATQDLWIGLVTLVCAAGAGFCACAIEVTRPYPAPRRSFVQMAAARRKRDPLDLLAIAVIQLGWSGGAWFLANRNAWGAAIVFGVLLVPFLEWWRDANRQSLLGY